MALSNADRQRRYRARRQAEQPGRMQQHRRPPQSRSRPHRWAAAVRTLCELQDEYQGWLDNLPDGLQATALGEKLEAICALDLSELESVELPRGYGRD